MTQARATCGPSPEPAHPEDSLEDRLHARVCDGQMHPAAVRLALARNWVKTYDRYAAG